MSQDGDRLPTEFAYARGIAAPEIVYCTSVNNLNLAFTGDDETLQPGYPALIVATGVLRFETDNGMNFTIDAAQIVRDLGTSHNVPFIFLTPANTGS